MIESGPLLLGIACLFGFIMAWGIGANDVSNAMGTSVGSKAVTIRQAIFIAIIFECTGAFLAGGEVTDTIRSGILNTSELAIEPLILILGMLSAMLAGGLWLALASFFGWPVSTTHTTVGAIVGFGLMALGQDAVKWHSLWNIVFSWILSPIAGGVIAYLLFYSVQKFILNKENPFKRAQAIVPLYMLLVFLMVTALIMFSGLKHMGIHIPFSYSCLTVGIISVTGAIIGRIALSRIKIDAEADSKFVFASVEKIFAVLMIVTACAMAFAHGSNDVANAIGPLAAIVSIVETNNITSSSVVPVWVLILGAGGIGIGLVTYGHKVIATIGTGITELTPTRGFAATLAAASTVVMASSTGLPVSTTHTLVGAILGVGLARGIGAINLQVVRKIFMSWVVTVPAGAFIAMASFSILKLCFA